MESQQKQWRFANSLPTTHRLTPKISMSCVSLIQVEIPTDSKNTQQKKWKLNKQKCLRIQQKNKSKWSEGRRRRRRQRDDNIKRTSKRRCRRQNPAWTTFKPHTFWTIMSFVLTSCWRARSTPTIRVDTNETALRMCSLSRPASIQIPNFGRRPVTKMGLAPSRICCSRASTSPFMDSSVQSSYHSQTSKITLKGRSINTVKYGQIRAK